MTVVAAMEDLRPQNYQRHALHADERIWVEKNCYVDLWIALLHALGHEPLAMLPFTVAVDFEGDQWTFYKPSHDELRELYGIDVQEMSVWRPLIEHAIEHLGAGKLVSTEADSFWLPDTAGTDYRRKHTKTTIVIAAVDPDARRMDYFHNAGFYSLADDDFSQLFMLDREPDPAHMPLFAEVIRLDRSERRHVRDLGPMAANLLNKHLRRLPSSNPVARFAARFERDLASLQQLGLDHYHAWAFNTIRQLGSATELTAMNLAWLTSLGLADHGAATAEFQRIAATCKTLILKVARAVNSGRPPATTPLFDEMTQAWNSGSVALRASCQVSQLSHEVYRCGDDSP